jgi:hypothetical protein
MCCQGVSVEKFVPPHVETGEEVAARAQDFLSTLLQEFDYLVRNAVSYTHVCRDTTLYMYIYTHT